MYYLRNGDNLLTLPRRLEIYSNSAIPSAIKLWNDLDPDIRNSNTLDEFKTKLKEKFKAPKVPAYYSHGERTYQVIQSRIRNHCSDLKAHLFENHLTDSPKCSCGYHTEDADHYFFKCSRYQDERLQMFINTRIFHPINSSTLMFGVQTLNYKANCKLFQEVQLFIKRTKRFNV